MGIFLLHILSLKYAENYSQGHLIDTAAATVFSSLVVLDHRDCQATDWH